MTSRSLSAPFRVRPPFVVNGGRNFYPERIAYGSPWLPRSGYPGMGFIITTSTLKGLRSVASASPKPRWGIVFSFLFPQGSRCAATLGYLITSPSGYSRRRNSLRSKVPKGRRTLHGAPAQDGPRGTQYPSHISDLPYLHTFILPYFVPRTLFSRALSHSVPYLGAMLTFA
jgi:hypothetical protein